MFSKSGVVSLFSSVLLSLAACAGGSNGGSVEVADSQALGSVDRDQAVAICEEIVAHAEETLPAVGRLFCSFPIALGGEECVDAEYDACVDEFLSEAGS